MALYFFHGQEEFLIEKDIQKLKEKLLDKNFLAMNYKTFSNPNFLDLMDILNTPPMMFGNSLVVVDCKNYFSARIKANLDSRRLYSCPLARRVHNLHHEFFRTKAIPTSKAFSGPVDENRFFGS